MKLLFVTPWPPQHTGIADYAYDLARGFVEQGHRVSILTDLENPQLLDGVDFHTPEFLCADTYSSFDKVIYHLGNNSNFHLFQLPLLRRYPGLVHLHDMVLHHLMAWILYRHGSINFYRRTVSKWYGPVVAANAEAKIQNGQHLWDQAEVIQVPFFEEALQYATGVVTHSSFSCNKVLSVFPHLPHIVLPQLYHDVVPHLAATDDIFRVGMFGGVDPNKRLEPVLLAIKACIEQGRRVELHIAGQIHLQSVAILEKYQTEPFFEHIHVHGRIEKSEFLGSLSHMDLCIALRFPTMGETSAVVMRALQAGTPTIVTNIGWYAELPAFVPKVAADLTTELAELTLLLLDFSSRSAHYKKTLSDAQLYASQYLSFDHTIEDYTAFLKS